MRGREALIGLEIYLSQSGPHGLSRPLTASHGLSNLSCDLSEPIRESKSVRPICEADWPLTHTGRESDPRGYLTDFTAKRIASPGVRERPIGLTDRPLTHTGRESDPRGYLTDFTAKRIASAGVRERPIGLSNL